MYGKPAWDSLPESKSIYSGGESSSDYPAWLKLMMRMATKYNLSPHNELPDFGPSEGGTHIHIHLESSPYRKALEEY
jgi:hypothetical protein